uniref:Xylanolytic transcriptional activator regulatory domain-containing protein n=1 Tax=Bionectria ochroleuca TaxID=29856 RepID=A0A8H7K723_BIOOC
MESPVDPATSSRWPPLKVNKQGSPSPPSSGRDDASETNCSRCAQPIFECTCFETILSLSGENLPVSELNDMLKRMDMKLDSHLSPPPSSKPQTPATVSSVSLEPPPTPLPASPLFFDTGRIREEIASAQKHAIDPQHLLAWPCSTLKLSKRELRYPTELEINRPKISKQLPQPVNTGQSAMGESFLSQVPMSQLHRLTQLYFSHFHPSCLILDENHFYSSVLNQAININFAESMDTCVVLLVCALGAVAARFLGFDEWGTESKENTGFTFFSLAQDMLRDLETADWASVQCLVLSGLFYTSKLRPYDAWRCIHRACCSVLILVRLQDRLDAHEVQLLWITYLQESQLLAEYDFPSSGLGKVAGSFLLPISPDTATDPRLAQYQFYFLSLITVRKIGNRILYYMYRRDKQQNNDFRSPLNSPAFDRPSMFLSASRSRIEELNRQLEEWREGLPDCLEFPAYSSSQDVSTGPFEPRPAEERLRGHLMACYYHIKSILYRPFIYRALHYDYTSTMLSEDDLEGARIAVRSSFLSTYHSGLFHEPLPLVLNPLSSWRSLFELEVQIAFCKKHDRTNFALPREWRMTRRLRQRVAADASHSCPTVWRDSEVLSRV